MLARFALLSRTPWFRLPMLLVALLLSVVLAPWMLVAVLATPGGVADGAVLASAALGTMGAAGLLGLAGLWLALVLPARVVDARPALATSLAGLLAIGSAAAGVGAAWCAAGGVFSVALGLFALSAAGLVLWTGVFEGRRARA